MTKTAFLWGVLLVVLTGCVTTKLADPGQDRDAKSFVPPAGKANLYIQRNSESFGSLVPFQILVDGQEAGNLSPGTYQLVTLSPGSHRIDAKASINSTSLAVTVAADKNYFYTVGAKAGKPIVQPELSLVLFEQMGRLMISQSSRALPAEAK